MLLTNEQQQQQPADDARGEASHINSSSEEKSLAEIPHSSSNVTGNVLTPFDSNYSNISRVCDVKNDDINEAAPIATVAPSGVDESTEFIAREINKILEFNSIKFPIPLSNNGLFLFPTLGIRRGCDETKEKSPEISSEYKDMEIIRRTYCPFKQIQSKVHSNPAQQQQSFPISLRDPSMKFPISIFCQESKFIDEGNSSYSFSSSFDCDRSEFSTRETEKIMTQFPNQASNENDEEQQPQETQDHCLQVQSNDQEYSNAHDDNDDSSTASVNARIFVNDDNGDDDYDDDNDGLVPTTKSEEHQEECKYKYKLLTKETMETATTNKQPSEYAENKNISTNTIITSDFLDFSNLTKILILGGDDGKDQARASILTPPNMMTNLLDKEQQVIRTTETKTTTFDSIETNSRHCTTASPTATASATDSEHFDAQADLAGVEQPLFVQPQNCSDVRDTSSQEVLADNTGAQVKTCPLEPQLDIDTKQYQASTLNSSNFLEFGPIVPHPLPHPNQPPSSPPPSLSPSNYSLPQSKFQSPPPLLSDTATLSVVDDKLPNLKLLPNYYALEQVERNECDWTELDKWNDIINTIEYAKDNNNNSNNYNNNNRVNIVSDDVINIHHIKLTRIEANCSEENFDEQPEAEINAGANNNSNSKSDGDRTCHHHQHLRRGGNIEMTIGEFEDDYHRETDHLRSQSPPSNTTGGHPEINCERNLSDEMRFEMRTAKGALPSTGAHDRLKSALPGNASSLSPTSTSTSLTSTSSSLLRSHPTTNIEYTPTRSQSSTILAYTPRDQGQKSSFNHPHHIQQQSHPPLHQQQPISHVLSSRLSNRPIQKTTAESARSVPSAEVSRSISVDNMDSILPSRTRLRRQRRMGSLDPLDQPEDPIERLNRLRARISGALSEVKTVLNKYSTETEPEGLGSPQTSGDQNDRNIVPAPKIEQAKPDDNANAPVQFRFVRKIRRRSVFNEEEEDKMQEENSVSLMEKREEKVQDEVQDTKKDEDTKTKTKNDDTKKDDGMSKTNAQCKEENSGTVLSQIEVVTADSPETPKDVDEVLKKKTKINEQSMKKTKVVDSLLGSKPNGNMRRSSVGTSIGISPLPIEENIKVHRRPSDSAAIIKKQQKELKNDLKLSNSSKKIPRKSSSIKKLTDSVEEKQSEIIEETEEKSQPIQEPPTVSPNGTSQTSTSTSSKSKKISSIKKKEIVRRASIAAVEESKIKPPINDVIPLEVKNKRRPSDSAAITSANIENNLASKVSTTTTTSTTTTATNKVKRSSIKNAKPSNASTTSSVGITAKLAPTIVIDSAKDEKTSANETLPAQLIGVIDDGASLITSSSIAPHGASTIGSQTAAAVTVDAVNSNSVITTDKKIEVTNAGTATTTTTTYSKDASVVIQKSDAPTIASFEEPISLPPANEVNSQPADLKPSATRRLLKDGDKTTELATTTKIDSQSEKKIDNYKKLINQRKIIPAISEVPLLGLPEKAQSLQQVVTAATTTTTKTAISDGAIATVQVSVPETPTTEITGESPPSEVNETVSECNDSGVKITAPSSSAAAADTTKTTDTSTKSSSAPETTQPVSPFESIDSAITAGAAVKSSEPGYSTKAKMPELQVLPKAVQVHPESKTSASPFNDEFAKKKIIFKKIVRKNSTEKAPAAATNNKLQIKAASNAAQAKNVQEIQLKVDTTNEEKIDEPEIADDSLIIEEPPAPPKEPRKVKKKVIIKRQQRKLSISDQTFFTSAASNDQEKEEKISPDVETIEKPIAYVTDDEDDANEDKDTAPQQPLKGCIRQREYQVGDWVMYAERYKKTQVRWKKGRVMERITSISYKLDIDGKEVPAHISYIKRYTDRKVSFSGKEYLEIDYEQIAEEEVKARSYSIWNMV